MISGQILSAQLQRLARILKCKSVQIRSPAVTDPDIFVRWVQAQLTKTNLTFLFCFRPHHFTEGLQLYILILKLNFPEGSYFPGGGGWVVLIPMEIYNL